MGVGQRDGGDEHITATPVRAVRRRDEVLAFVVEEIARKGASPTIREIADHLGVSQPRVRELVGQLEREGVIYRVPGSQRAIRVHDLGETRASLVEACLRLGWKMPGVENPFPQGKLTTLPPIRYLPGPDPSEEAA